MIRWKGVIFIGVIAVIIFVLSLFLTDLWLEEKLESVGSSIVGAKVDIDNLNISLSSMSVKWERLQITDPKNTMNNMVETAECEYDLEFWPLLSKKIIIEDFRVTGIRTNTQRETDGKLPDAQLEDEGKEPGFIEQTTNQLTEQVSSNVSMNVAEIGKKANIDSIIGILNIQSIEKITNVQKELADKFKYWENESEVTEKIESDVTKIETTINSINVQQIKDINQLQQNLKKIDEVKKTIEKLTNEYGQKKDKFVSDFSSIQDQVGQVDNWIKEDYERARKMAKLPEFSVENIARLLFGQQLVGQINQYLGYIATAREYSAKLGSDEPEKQDPPRLKGQDIYFYSENARPDFWIQNMQLSGVINQDLNLEGNITDIVSDQRFINKPTTIAISGNSGEKISFSLDGELDYLTESPQESFKAQYTGFSLSGTSLSDYPLLPSALEEGTGELTATLNLAGESLLSEVDFSAAGVTFGFNQQATGEIERLVQKTIRNVSSIAMKARIKGQNKDLDISISSTLDKVLADNLKSVVSEELEEQKKQIKARVEKEVGKYRNELNTFVTSQEETIRKQFKQYEDLIEKEQARIDEKKKEIEKKIEEEKSKLGKDVQKKLNDLFK